MTPQKVFKTFNLIKIGVLWVWKNLWGSGRKVHAKFWHGGPPGTRVMTMFVFYVSAQIPNIEYFEANEVYKSREVSHLFSHQIFFRMPSESCLGTPLGLEL